MMSNIQEVVARAFLADAGLDYDDRSVEMQEVVKKRAKACIIAFLEAAAEQGWHMRPDEATEEMRIANCELDCGYAVCHKAVGGPQCVNHGERRKYSDESWTVMSAAAPKFEWRKGE